MFYLRCKVNLQVECRSDWSYLFSFYTLERFTQCWRRRLITPVHIYWVLTFFRHFSKYHMWTSLFDPHNNPRRWVSVFYSCKSEGWMTGPNSSANKCHSQYIRKVASAHPLTSIHRTAVSYKRLTRVREWSQPGTFIEGVLCDHYSDSYLSSDT